MVFSTSTAACNGKSQQQTNSSNPRIDPLHKTGRYFTAKCRQSKNLGEKTAGQREPAGRKGMQIRVNSG
ncbi:hypothetical protein RNAN_1630 [Rheinheimera nanhaiensis E407-8]|uniref:Uncharacterized protein n=1 Tax=Rheinheimera nanhaiensis E407-8 TaxID=562729 RepID=I1DX72_9GAMM|nr:hypothetical protein RNAN_1630 [Rheinheimera nanhaiensis E407-8]